LPERPDRPPLAMTVPPPELAPPHLIQDQAGVRALLELLARASEIAVDTEADSFFRYREKVCLIQVSALEQDFVVDPLAGLDLAGLGAVLADAARLKVFHDGEYDVAILKRDFGFGFANLFDTRIAASALGVKAPGLASVLAEHFGVALDKSLQRSDWSRRPLSPEQLSYARLDTRYLVPLMHRQRVELEARERAMIVAGECRRLERLAPMQRSVEPEAWRAAKGARQLNGLGLRLLAEAWAWREREAERRDVPLFKVLGDQQLVDLALCFPSSPRQLGEVRSIPPKVQRVLARELLRLAERARSLGPLDAPARPDPAVSARALEDEELRERLKSWRKAEADVLGVDASLVLNRHALERLVRERPASRAALEAMPEIQPWQIERYAPALLERIERFGADLAAGRVDLRPRRGRRN
jgi:ribonuclease D